MTSKEFGGPCLPSGWAVFLNEAALTVLQERGVRHERNLVHRRQKSKLKSRNPEIQAEIQKSTVKSRNSL